MDSIAVILIAGVVGAVAGMLVAFRGAPPNAVAWGAAVVIGLVGGWLGGEALRVLDVAAGAWIGAAVVGFALSALVQLLVARLDRDPGRVDGPPSAEGARYGRSTTGRDAQSG